MVSANPRRVWIVDDSPLDGERAMAALRSEHAVDLFSDGTTMLERLASGAPPDVMVLDWVMPGMSGLELCQFIRTAEGSNPRIGVLLLTAHSDTEQVVQALDAGANDFLAKPYADDELRARVAALLRNKAFLERMESAERNVRALLSNAPDALLAVDLRGRVTFANREAEHAFGTSTAEITGRTLEELLPELRFDALRLGGHEALLPLPDVKLRDQIYSPTVRVLPTDFAAARTISLHNVTEHRRTEARRLDFYSIIAHDLRSPLSAMMLRTAAILSGRRGVLSGPLTEDVRKMDANIRSMVALINDFLDLARLEGAGYKIDREPVDVSALVRATIDDVRPLAEESQLVLSAELPTGVVVETVGDRRRLGQVLTNLLSNAIKFTPAGGRVTMRVRREGDIVAIDVEDTGRGISDEALPTLFERYTRVIDPQHQVAGTGLGLMIVREIVEAHGGTVRVQSSAGKGSTFSVRLPREPVAGSARLDVLIVDDDADVRESLVFVLEAEGYNVRAAADGAEALEVLRRTTPCAVLLDIMMPTLSGWEVLDRLREQPQLSRLPVCVISASVHKGEVLPNVTVMPKPIDVERLLGFVKQHCAPRAAAANE
ncbi:MAG TPA: response regulator [Polyangia bacterium]|nr:response regulator [Polyangia bacterium]